MTMVFALAALTLVTCGLGAIGYEPSHLAPPWPQREFRGVWIATVANLDWPSKPGLSTAAQKTELIALLDRVMELKLNAVIFQVRPACDAFYASQLEPWSEYLTGTMGKPPEPFYDPLAFATAEAHKRGLELHAWFNPYRALHPKHKGGIASNHISRTQPALAKKLTGRDGNFLWLDPGERAVADHSLNVMMDVVRRYDIDGVHIDDYFYPDLDAGTDFPDDPSWRKYGAGGRLNRQDWRRENVNAFVERVYRSVKAAKPWVKFGVSPRGIWRPGHPPKIAGQDAYVALYADSRKWLMSGWVDYLAPQLYWPDQPEERSFSALQTWWSEQNLQNRHLWPGIAAYNAGSWKPGEIPNQIRITRNRSGDTGYILYRASHLVQNTALAGALGQVLNTEPALVPASPWLGAPPARPTLSATNRASQVKATWQTAGTNVIRLWLVQSRSGGNWTTAVFPAERTSHTFHSPPPELIAVSAVDRAGNVSLPSVIAAKPPPAPAPSSEPAAKRPLRKQSSPKDGGEP